MRHWSIVAGAADVGGCRQGPTGGRVLFLGMWCGEQPTAKSDTGFPGYFFSSGYG